MCCLFLFQSRSSWRYGNKQWKSFASPHITGPVQPSVHYQWHQDAQTSGIVGQGSEDLCVLSASAGKDYLTQWNNEIYKTNFAWDLTADRHSRTEIKTSVLENILLFAGWCVTANVQWQTTSLFLIYIQYAWMLFHLGYFEFNLQFKLTEVPGTSHRVSSSHICSVSKDSMISSMKRRGKVQGLKKNERRKKSGNGAWAFFNAAQKWQLTGSKQKQWIKKKKKKKFSLASFMKMPHFHGRVRILYVIVITCQKSCHAPCSILKTASRRTRRELVGMHWALLCLNWRVSPKQPDAFLLFFKVRNTWTH